MLKFDTLTRLDAIDPLPKLGRKVEPEYKSSPRLERALEVCRFEYSASRIDDLDAAISRAVKAAAEHVGTEVFAKAMLDGCIASGSSVEMDGGLDYLSHNGMVSGGNIISEPIQGAVFYDYSGNGATTCSQAESSPQLDNPVVIEPQAKTDPDGWIEWGGGERPVAPDTVVDVRFSDNTIGEGEDADVWRWTWLGDSGDIIDYRIHKQPEATKTAPTLETVHDAFTDACRRVGELPAHNAIQRVKTEPCGRIENQPECWPAAIAALNALK